MLDTLKSLLSKQPIEPAVSATPKQNFDRKLTVHTLDRTYTATYEEVSAVEAMPAYYARIAEQHCALVEALAEMGLDAEKLAMAVLDENNDCTGMPYWHILLRHVRVTMDTDAMQKDGLGNIEGWQSMFERIKRS